VGMSQEDMDDKNNDLKEMKKETNEHVGLSNVNHHYPCDRPFILNDATCEVCSREFRIENKWGKAYFVLRAQTFMLALLMDHS